MLFAITIDGIGTRYLDADTEAITLENATWIWPNNRAVSAEPAITRAER